MYIYPIFLFPSFIKKSTKKQNINLKREGKDAKFFGFIFYQNEIKNVNKICFLAVSSESRRKPVSLELDN